LIEQIYNVVLIIVWTIIVDFDYHILPISAVKEYITV